MAATGGGFPASMETLLLQKPLPPSTRARERPMGSLRPHGTRGCVPEPCWWWHKGRDGDKRVRAASPPPGAKGGHGQRSRGSCVSGSGTGGTRVAGGFHTQRDTIKGISASPPPAPTLWVPAVLQTPHLGGSRSISQQKSAAIIEGLCLLSLEHTCCNCSFSSRSLVSRMPLCFNPRDC